jgi:MATE family multidrug resistance protein
LSVCGRQVSLALGQDPEVAASAGRFLLALAPGVVPSLLFAALKYYLDALGRTRVAMWVMFVGVAVNVVGNRVFIYGVPGVVRPLGVAGSGLSTTLVRWAMFLVIVGYVARHRELSPFRGASLRPNLERLRRIAAIGAPIGAQLGAEIGTFSLAAVMMGWLGPAQLAAHQVTLSLASAAFMVAVGASVAGSIRVGRAVGARRPRGVRRAAVAAYLVSISFMSVTALTFLAFPRFLIGLYTHDPGVVRYGTALLFMAALFQVFDGGQVTGISVLRGAADTRVPMLITCWATGPSAFPWRTAWASTRRCGTWGSGPGSPCRWPWWPRCCSCACARCSGCARWSPSPAARAPRRPWPTWPWRSARWCWRTRNGQRSVTNGAVGDGEPSSDPSVFLCTIRFAPHDDA